MFVCQQLPVSLHPGRNAPSPQTGEPQTCGGHCEHTLWRKSYMSKFRFNLCGVVAFVCVLFAPHASRGQDSSKTPAHSATNESPSRWDIFAGYSYLAPHGTVNGYAYNAINYGGIASVTRYFNNYVGFQGEGDVHLLTPEDGHISKTQPNNDFSGGSGGLIFRFPTEEITPFVHGLVGGEHVGSYYQPERWGVVLTAGGGMDYSTPLFSHHLALRLFQADYQYTHENFGPGARGNFKNARLSAGLVWHIGTIAPPVAPTLACSANPSSVFPGEPVTITATANGLNPKEHALYSWSGDGVSGSDSTAKVDTSNLAPGPHTVKCGVKEGKPGKEGLKPWQVADSSTTFTVKEFEPPTISCSASPSTIKPGDSATITATAVSPQNRPLTYTYAAQSGSVNGSGGSATYNSAGAQPGTVQVNCSVVDDKGHSASSTAPLEIVAPPPPPPPGPTPEQVQLEQRLALHSVFFPTAQPTAKHPEGGLVESQQATLLALATDFKRYLEIKPDARLTLTGHADVRGSAEFNQALSERRVARTKSFLVEHGIPDASIQTQAVGKEQQMSADQVKEMLQQDQQITEAQRKKALREFRIIVLAQNRRVDVSLSTTGQQSVKQFPFSAADSMTLLDQKKSAARKKTGGTKK
ncbi:OmpA family protein [Acidobacteria bacterium AB60]|nr:OmpA family protein [Acidobacteria bacterium AB60]